MQGCRLVPPCWHYALYVSQADTLGIHPDHSCPPPNSQSPPLLGVKNPRYASELLLLLWSPSRVPLVLKPCPCVFPLKFTPCLQELAHLCVSSETGKDGAPSLVGPASEPGLFLENDQGPLWHYEIAPASFLPCLIWFISLVGWMIAANKGINSGVSQKCFFFGGGGFMCQTEFCFVTWPICRLSICSID